MSLSPKEFGFEIGSFLALFFPGAILLFVIFYNYEDTIIFQEGKEYSRTISWFLIFVTSYFLGHFVNWIGTFLDWTYDRLYKPIKKRKSSIGKIKRTAQRIKSEILNEYGELAEDDHTFLYARKYITIKNSNLDKILNRIDAESKFFRSLISVFLISFLVFLLNFKIIISLLSVLFLILSFGRYWSLRWKHTRETYNYFVMQYSIDKKDR